MASIVPDSIFMTRYGKQSGNIAIFDFELSETDMAAIATLDTDRRGGPDPEVRAFAKSVMVTKTYNRPPNT